MKNLITLLLLCFLVFGSQAQIILSIPPANTVIPINSKLTLKLITVDSVNYTYDIVKSEPFTELIDTDEHNELLSGPVEANTIELIFCRGTHGKSKKEKDKNLMTLLIIKNGSANTLACTADQLRSYETNFKSEHDMILYPNLKLTENWLFVFDQLYLRDFKVKKRR